MKRWQKYIFVFLLCLGVTAAWPQEPILHSTRLVAPFDSFEEAEEALRTARIVKAKELGTGVTNPLKFYLQHDAIEFKACFKTVNDRHYGITRLQKNAEVDFKDCWMFEIAAYELDKLMGLNMVPPTVERIYKGKKGSIQLWVEDAMTEKERKLKKLEPPDINEWNRQIFQVRLFDNLIYNIDRNLGNLLITPDWRIHMIDHSRCFKSLDLLKAPGDLTVFSKSTMEALEKIDILKLKACCSRYLNGPEMLTLLKRRDMIMHQYQTLLAEKGEAIYFPWN